MSSPSTLEQRRVEWADAHLENLTRKRNPRPGGGRRGRPTDARCRSAGLTYMSAFHRVTRYHEQKTYTHPVSLSLARARTSTRRNTCHSRASSLPGLRTPLLCRYRAP
jgi:hypothetical protein